MASVAKRFEEHPEFWRRTVLSGREVIRRHEERRKVGLPLERREQSGRRSGGPTGGRETPEERRVMERSHPQGAERIFIRTRCDEFAAAATLHECEGWGSGPMVHRRVGPEEVFRREG